MFSEKSINPLGVLVHAHQQRNIRERKDISEREISGNYVASMLRNIFSINLIRTNMFLVEIDENVEFKLLKILSQCGWTILEKIL